MEQEGYKVDADIRTTESSGNRREMGTEQLSGVLFIPYCLCIQSSEKTEYFQSEDTEEEISNFNQYSPNYIK